MEILRIKSKLILSIINYRIKWVCFMHVDKRDSFSLDCVFWGDIDLNLANNHTFCNYYNDNYNQYNDNDNYNECMDLMLYNAMYQRLKGLK